MLIDPGYEIGESYQTSCLKNRYALIILNGKDALVPCVRCAVSGNECILLRGSSRCGRCVLRHYMCVGAELASGEYPRLQPSWDPPRLHDFHSISAAHDDDTDQSMTKKKRRVSHLVRKHIPEKRRTRKSGRTIGGETRPDDEDEIGILQTSPQHSGGEQYQLTPPNSASPAIWKSMVKDALIPPNPGLQYDAIHTNTKVTDQMEILKVQRSSDELEIKSLKHALGDMAVKMAEMEKLQTRILTKLAAV